MIRIPPRVTLTYTRLPHTTLVRACDARDERLYIVETAAQRISRLRISDDGAGLGREIFGPSNLGPGFPDGIAFDVAGNLWCAVAMADRIIALTPQGDVLTLLSEIGRAHV